MKSFKLFPVLLFLTACGSGIPKYCSSSHGCDFSSF